MKSVRYSESCTCFEPLRLVQRAGLGQLGDLGRKLLLLLAQTFGRVAVGDFLVHRVLLLLLGLEALLDLELALQQRVQVLGQAAAQAGRVALARRAVAGFAG